MLQLSAKEKIWELPRYNQAQVFLPDLPSMWDIIKKKGACVGQDPPVAKGRLSEQCSGCQSLCACREPERGAQTAAGRSEALSD